MTQKRLLSEELPFCGLHFWSFFDLIPRDSELVLWEEKKLKKKDQVNLSNYFLCNGVLCMFTQRFNFHFVVMLANNTHSTEESKNCITNFICLEKKWEIRKIERKKKFNEKRLELKILLNSIKSWKDTFLEELHTSRPYFFRSNCLV